MSLVLPLSGTVAELEESRHRRSIRPQALFGERRDDANELGLARFRLHVTETYVRAMTPRFDLVTGVGAAIDTWPLARFGLAPEVGARVRLRRCARFESFDCFPTHATLSVRAAFFATKSDPAELSVLVGYAIF